MSPEVHRLFEGAVALPIGRRAAWLQAETSDPAVLREVDSLLAYDTGAEPFLDEALASAAVSVRQEMELASGARIGAFAIQRLLGRGGMGAVYLAMRVEGSFEQTVAIKVIQFAGAGELLRQRFEQERQILARLNHPNIARLLDGGETSSGLPYFVLEYVEGEEIDRYCERHGLGLRACLGMLLQIAGAVQYAHENLVVHRDIKPGNILVGADGSPKLLDFGIAKVLDPAHAGGQRSSRILTPEYASPEQVRGDPITTAADVYSLGAVLYRLLTGKPPHESQERSPLAIAQAISGEVAAPAAGVPGDVQSILQKALHTDPRRRYRSVSELSADIERFLQGKPVAAAPDSFGYRARKFLRRQWLPMSAGAAVALALAAGTVVSTWQARRAERRFTEVRRLSNRFLFEVEDALHGVAGATKARELVVETAQEYLNRLAAEAGGDRELIREVADAYKKLGDVQGSTAQGNTGKTKEALDSYRKGLALRDSIADDETSVPAARIAYLLCLIALSDLEVNAGDAARGRQLGDRAVALAEKWMSSGAKDSGFLAAAASAHAQVSSHQSDEGKFRAAVESAKKSLAIGQQALETEPGNSKLLRVVAFGYWAVGRSEREAGNAQQSVEGFTKVVELLGRIDGMAPGNVSLRRELATASWQLALSTKKLVMQQKKDLGAVVPLFENALHLGRQLLRDDPANALVQNDVGGMSLALGSALYQAGRPRESLEVLQPAIASARKQLDDSPANRERWYRLALLEMWAADCDRSLKNPAGALTRRRTAQEIQDKLLAANPRIASYAYTQGNNLRAIGDLLAERGDSSAALAQYHAGLEIAAKIPKGSVSLDAQEVIDGLNASIRRLSAAVPRTARK